jgi:hypothetical protein
MRINILFLAISILTVGASNAPALGRVQHIMPQQLVQLLALVWKPSWLERIKAMP